MDEMYKFKIAGTTINQCVTVLEPCKYPEAVLPCTAPAPNKRTKQMSRYYDEYNDCFVEGIQTDVQDSREYFRNRVRAITGEIETKLMRQFGLMDDEAPTNFEEFLARIQAGKYVFDDEKRRTNTPYWRDYIVWRDPSVKKDKAGYKAALEAFEKEAGKTLDVVMALPADKAMEAVQALETWTYTK